MSALGAALDRWLTTPPEYPGPLLPCEPGWPRCACGALLRLEPDQTEHREQSGHCDGDSTRWDPPCGETGPHAPHEFTAWTWDEHIRQCRRCRRENRQTEA